MWPNGATLKLRFLDKDHDAEHYIGHSYTWVGFDQGEQWPNPKPIDKLRATLRAGEIAMPKYFRMTANPGGVGHNWIKARYRIGVNRPMSPFYDQKLSTERVYIPSRLEDNEALMKNDPLYWKRVEASVAGNKDLLKAWRWGLWDITAGGMFDDVFNEDVHVFDEAWWPNSNWWVDRSLDWGSSRPFSVGWYATSPGDFGPRRVWLPYGSKIRFMEWYGCRYELTHDDEDMNEGLKLSSREVGRGIKEFDKQLQMEHGLHVNPGGCDSSIYAVHDDKSIADEFKAVGVTWKEADKGPGSRKVGWELMRTRLKAMLALQEKKNIEEPGYMIARRCAGWLRTVPSLPRDDVKVDDVDTESEDHPADENRYNFGVKVPKVQVSEFLM
jgi:hypothetical protein